MSSRLRHACIALAIVALALLSHGRLFRAGWLGGDLEVLDHARAVPAGADEGYVGDNQRSRAGWLDFGRIRPIPGAVLVAHERLFGAQGSFAPNNARSLRIVAFVVLLATAAAAGFALRRALVPWIGGDTARAAGFALACFAATHPLGTAAVARPAALGDLFALFFACLAAFLFLRGRQEREKRWVVAAAVCAVLAGFSSSVALLLPIVLFGLELGSARRPRPFFARLRTAATTFVVFLGCVLVANASAALWGVPAVGFDRHAWSDAPRALEACIEKLGILFLPVSGEDGSGASLWPSYLLSGALVLIALWPVLRSARAAPRLWGWLGIAWMLAMAAALLPHAFERVEPGDDSHAEILVAAMLFACAGLAVASTALLGTRRILLPAVIAIGFAWLGGAAARGFDRASGTLEDLRADILGARDADGRDAEVLLVDPPDRAHGLDLGLASLSLLAPEPGAHAPRRLVRDALDILSRTSEFASWRTTGLVLVAPAGTFGGTTELSARRIVRIVPPAAGSPPPVLWPRGENRSGWFDLDPGATHCARVVGLPTASTAEAPRLRWRVSEPSRETFGAIGVWLRGETAPVAVFDLAGSSDWWTAPTVRRAWTESPFTGVASGEMLADIPLAIAAGGPELRGDDWTFAIERTTLPAPVRGEAIYVLELIDMASFAFARIDVHESGGETSLELRAPGAGGFERAMPERGGPVYWSLERRVGGTTIARASGRRG